MLSVESLLPLLYTIIELQTEVKIRALRYGLSPKFADSISNLETFYVLFFVYFILRVVVIQRIPVVRDVVRLMESLIFGIICCFAFLYFNF
jgi:hypothetical protein